jgi:transposase
MFQSIWIGLDVHADSITAAILVGEAKDAEVIQLPGDLQPVRRLFRRLAERGTPRACYEASGAGFVLHRVLTQDGFHCEVIAPSLIRRKPGDRRKTDRLDAVMLAKLYRSGHLTPVHIPSEQQEALRRLLRLRSTYQIYCKSTKHRISGMMRDHGHAYSRGKSTWTKSHRTWLSQLRNELEGPLQTALATELEHLNTHARRLLTEAAWNNRHAQAATLLWQRRRQGQPPPIVAVALKAQHRLAKKFRHLDARKHRHVAITAVARELCGFVWAVLNAVPQS